MKINDLTPIDSNVASETHRRISLAGRGIWRGAIAAAVLYLCALPALAASEPSSSPPTPGVPAKSEAQPVTPAPAPDAAPVQTATPDEIRAAEIKVRQTEIDYIQAKIELEQLKGRQEVSKLQEQVDAAQAALTVLNAAQADAEGFIRKWLVLGPLAVDEKVANHDEESCKAMLDRAYVPANATPKEGDPVTIDGAQRKWKLAEAPEYYIDLSKMAEDAGLDAEHDAYLGFVYITSENEVADAKLAIGSDDGSVWRLNEKEVLRSYEGRPVDKDQNTVENLTLKKGVNVLTFTVLNGEGPAAAAARFLNKDDEPLKGLKFSLTVPEK